MHLELAAAPGPDYSALTPYAINIVVGFLVPLLVAAVARLQAPSELKAVLNLLFGAITGTLTSLAGPFHWIPVLLSIGQTWVISWGSYVGFHKPTGISLVISQAVPGIIGSPSSPTTGGAMSKPKIPPPNVPPPAREPAVSPAAGTVHDRLALLPGIGESPLAYVGKQRFTPDSRDLKVRRVMAPARAAKIVYKDWTSAVAAFSMLLNDRLGDCTIAGWLHAVQVWAANAGNPAFTPTDAMALEGYEQCCGYNPANPNSDQGDTLRHVLGYCRKVGIGGHKVEAYAQVNVKNPAEMARAIELFGCLYIGVNLPLAAQKLGVEWVRTGRGPQWAPGSWGGHCVILSGALKPRTARSIPRYRLVSWGQVGEVTQHFLDAFCDEAWAPISPDWMNAAGVDPEGLDQQALQSYLSSLAA